MDFVGTLKPQANLPQAAPQPQPPVVQVGLPGVPEPEARPGQREPLPRAQASPLAAQLRPTLRPAQVVQEQLRGLAQQPEPELPASRPQAALRLVSPQRAELRDAVAEQPPLPFSG